MASAGQTRRWSIVACIAAVMTVSITLGLSWPLLPVYALDKGLDEESAALLITLFVLESVLGQVPVGWLADHVEHRRLLFSGCLTTIIALVAVPVFI